MVVQNFWRNSVVNLCKLLVPPIGHFICDAIDLFKGGKHDAPRINWMNDAIYTPQKPMLLKSGKPNARFKKLVEAAEEENNAEIEIIETIASFTAEHAEDVIEKGEKRLTDAIAKIEQEIIDLEDEHHVLENKLKTIWETELPAYTSAKFDLYTAQNNHALNGQKDKHVADAQQAVDKIIHNIQQKAADITTDFDAEKGYQNGKNTYVKEAVDYFYDVAKIYADAHALQNYRAVSKLHRHQAELFKAKPKKKPQIINVELKPVNE